MAKPRSRGLPSEYRYWPWVSLTSFLGNIEKAAAVAVDAHHRQVVQHVHGQQLDRAALAVGIDVFAHVHVRVERHLRHHVVIGQHQVAGPDHEARAHGRLAAPILEQHADLQQVALGGRIHFLGGRGGRRQGGVVVDFGGSGRGLGAGGNDGRGGRGNDGGNGQGSGGRARRRWRRGRGRRDGMGGEAISKHGGIDKFHAILRWQELFPLSCHQLSLFARLSVSLTVRRPARPARPAGSSCGRAWLPWCSGSCY